MSIRADNPRAAGLEAVLPCFEAFQAARLDFAMSRGRADSGDHEIVELMRAVRSPPISPDLPMPPCEHTLVQTTDAPGVSLADY